MKTYFEYKGHKVIEYKNNEFANYEVTETNQCFNELNEAICYCIAVADGNKNNSQLMAYVDTFLTMIKQANR